jgi:uncharacterized protein YabE (DUF348 family)
VPGWTKGLLALALVAAVLLLLILGLQRTSSSLVIEVDGERIQLNTHAATVGAALETAGVHIYPEDIVIPGPSSSLLQEESVRIQRARPVLLSVDGQVSQVRTQAETIAGLLTEQSVILGVADEIWLNDRLVGPETTLSSEFENRQVSNRGGARAVGVSDNTPGGVSQPVAAVPVIRLRRATEITLDDAGVTTTLRTTLATVGQVLQANGLTLYLGDEISPVLQSPVRTGMMVHIQRSVPVSMVVDGRTLRTRTLAKDVAGVLGQESIALVGLDTVEPTLDAPLDAGMEIKVSRVREEYKVEFDAVPFQTEWVPDPGVEIDNIRLVREGQVGLTKRRFRVVYENGQGSQRVLEDVWHAQPPITKTMAYGTKIVLRTLDTPEGPVEYWRKMRVYVTSYKPSSTGKSKGHPRYGYTRLGHYLRRGIVATDPEVIPLRTKMYVPGYGKAYAGDTGGGVKGKLVDLGFGDDDYESWHWWMDVYLLAPVPPASDIRWILPDYPRFPDRGKH